MSDVLKVPYTKQPNDYTCAPSCLRMILNYYGLKNPRTGRAYTVKELSKLCETGRAGTPLKAFNRTLRSLGLRRKKLEHIMDVVEAIEDTKAPVLACIPDPEIPEDESHMVVVKGLENYNTIVMADPYYGRNSKLHSVKFMEEVEKDGNWLYVIEKE